MNWQIKQNDDGTYSLVDPEGNVVEHKGSTTFADHVQAMAVLGELLELQAAEGDAPEGEDARAVTADLLFEGVETDEGGLVRIIDQGATEWRDPPQPIMLQDSNEGHYGAELAGRFTEFTREGSTIVARGFLDHSDAGDRLLQILEEHGRFGISADPIDGDADTECTEYDEDGWCVAARMEVHRLRIAGGTAIAFPAFEDAHIRLENPNASEETEEEPEAAAASASPINLRPDLRSLTAAMKVPVAPPSSWLEDPGFGATSDEDPRLVEFPDHPGKYACPMTFTDDGRVFGHVAPWEICHVGSAQGIFDSCIIAPHSAYDYAHFRLGATRPADCDCDIPTGTLTMATNHASIKLAHREAADHYANTGLAVADFVTGEDEHGIWMAGALRPTVTPEQMRALRGSTPSGDWRRIGGNLELIAVLAVNTPGFGVPRVQVRTASGEPQALVAAGAMVMARGQRDPRDREIESLRAEVRGLRAVVGPLEPQARDALRERIAATAS